MSGAALSMVLHEIRQPLATLSNVAALLGQDAKAASLEPLVDLLTRSVEEVVRLTDDFGEMARLAVGEGLRLRREPCDLAELVRRVASECAVAFRRKDQHLALRIPDASLRLLADPSRLRQAIGNLLENACKYTPAGGNVALSVRSEGANAVVEMRDSGCGIAPEDQEVIFDLFQRRDAGQAGSGIGLFLVRRLVELHGGEVKASSEGRGKGSVFTVRLPLAVSGPCGAG